MPRLPLPLRVALVLVLLGTRTPQGAGAQGAPPTAPKPVGLLVTSRPAAHSVDPGSTLTTSFRVQNPSLDSLTVMPHISVPAGWSLVLGDAPFVLASREADTWLVSVRVPARAGAGRHAIQLRAADPWGHALLADSLVVEVRSRHGVDLALAERPSYAVSGVPYGSAFLVHNRGNVAATFALRATSSSGTLLDPPSSIALEANESKLVRIAVSVVLSGQEVRDDVLELRATDVADTTVRATASAGVLVVQKAGRRSELHTVASTLRLRAAGSAAGVSPYELMGSGRLRDGGKEQVEFVVRGKPAPGSPFGDREEYRVGLRGAHFSTQIGDALYMSSPLTSGGQRGFGGGLTLGDSSLGIGAYAQRFRFQPAGGSEQGAFARLGSDRLFGAPRLGLSGVTRQGGPLAGQLLGASATLHPVGDMVVDLEYAGSRGASGQGTARSARLSVGEGVHVDLGHLDADSSYAGPSRGSQYDYASLSTMAWNELQLRGSLGASRTRTTRFGNAAANRSRTGLAELSYKGRYAIGYASNERVSTGGLLSSSYAQRGVTARGEESFGRGRLWGSAEAGRATTAADSAPRSYGLLSGGASAQLGGSMLSLFGEASRGATMLRGGERVLTLGFDAQVQLPAKTIFALSGADTRIYESDGGYTYLDARLAHTLSTGASVSMRVRVGGRDIHEAALGQKLAYLEYSTPFRLPIGPSRASGRVQGRVVDQLTGRGVAGALVRLGPQAAITDDDGQVAFAGLPTGAHRVSLAQQLASGSSVFSGNPDVQVDSASRRPTTFDVAVEPAGRISGTVRQLVVARTGIGAVPDSLADGGPLHGVPVALVGTRDTLYRVTDASGAYVFTDVPSGSWTVIVMGETLSQTQWEQERVPVAMSAGAKPVVDFRLVPKRRRVRIESGDGIDESGGGVK